MSLMFIQHICMRIREIQVFKLIREKIPTDSGFYMKSDTTSVHFDEKKGIFYQIFEDDCAYRSTKPGEDLSKILAYGATKEEKWTEGEFEYCEGYRNGKCGCKEQG